MRELKTALENVGVYNVMEEDLELVIKNYGDGNSSLTYNQFKSMLLPYGKELRVNEQ